MTSGVRSELRLTVSVDHDGECGVEALLTSGVFRGCGHAWLNVSDVEEFSAAAKRLASSSSGEAVLSGGYFGSDGAADYTVRLVLRPLGNRGHIMLAAELADGPRAAGSNSDRNRLLASLIIEPAALERFAGQVAGVVAGARVEAVLGGESVA
jgi:hypothetical protein